VVAGSEGQDADLSEDRERGPGSLRLSVEELGGDVEATGRPGHAAAALADVLDERAVRLHDGDAPASFHVTARPEADDADHRGRDCDGDDRRHQIHEQ
jgi:hypothetical protein